MKAYKWFDKLKWEELATATFCSFINLLYSKSRTIYFEENINIHESIIHGVYIIIGAFFMAPLVSNHILEVKCSY